MRRVRFDVVGEHPSDERREVLPRIVDLLPLRCEYERSRGRCAMKSRANGEGRIFRPAYVRKGVRQQVRVWYIQYTDPRRPKGQQQVRESSKSEKKTDAVKLLRQRLDDLAKGRPAGPDVEATTLGDLAEMIVNDYKVNGRRSLGRIEECLAHVIGNEGSDEGFFGKSYKAAHVTDDRISAYIAHRKDEKAKNATINRELACLRRMFRLAEKARKVVFRPEITMLQENNVRKGFLQPDQVRQVVAHLDADLAPVVEVASITGWRVASEVLTRQWHHVDFKGGWLRLEPGETKNNEPRMFPLTRELRTVLERQRERTTALEQAEGRIIPWVFHRAGEPIRTFRRSWITACRKAGVPGKIPHDLRRSAVRRLEAVGVPRTTAMKLVGHKTESIYRRYAIVSEAEMKEAAAKLEGITEEKVIEPKVVEFAK